MKKTYVTFKHQIAMSLNKRLARLQRCLQFLRITYST